jgi:16S rRNA (cytosine967-C5)-methyltransferase
VKRPKPKNRTARNAQHPTRPRTVHAPPDRGLDARRLALDLIEAVLGKRRSLDEALAAAAQRPAGDLDPRDRAFARLMAATVLRRHGQLTALVDTFVAQPLPEEARRAHHILLMAAAQLVLLRSPPHAAIDTAVTLCKGHKRTYRFRGLVNAVLRRIAERGDAVVAQQDDVALNVPAWLLAGWQADYGPALARKIAAASLREADLDLTVKANAPDWAERLGGRVLTDWSIRLSEGSGRIDLLAGFAEGAWWVQDFAASLPARLLGPVTGGRIADLCAAPGGKTAQLVVAGAAVTAVDSSAERLERLSANLTRLGLKATAIAADARTWTPDAPLDGILLDAPCSATGTIRRHPDILHLKSAADGPSLAALQTEMLAHAANQLAPGGVLVYSTCALEKAEGEEQIERILAARADLTRMPVSTDEIGGLSHLLNGAGDLRTLPCHAPGPTEAKPGMDGFFASRLRKRT